MTRAACIADWGAASAGSDLTAGVDEPLACSDNCQNHNWTHLDLPGQRAGLVREKGCARRDAGALESPLATTNERCVALPPSAAMQACSLQEILRVPTRHCKLATEMELQTSYRFGAETNTVGGWRSVWRQLHEPANRPLNFSSQFPTAERHKCNSAVHYELRAQCRQISPRKAKKDRHRFLLEPQPLSFAAVRQGMYAELTAHSLQGNQGEKRKRKRAAQREFQSAVRAAELNVTVVSCAPEWQVAHPSCRVKLWSLNNI